MKDVHRRGGEADLNSIEVSYPYPYGHPGFDKDPGKGGTPSPNIE